MGRHYHIETDGEVYLVRDGTTLRLPTSAAELPCPVDERFDYEALPGETVIVCRPNLDAHPTDWTYKDSLPERTDIDPIAQKAINVSLPRCVVSLAITRPTPSVDGEDTAGAGIEVLMVRSSRGMTRGQWNIPGGFVEFNEHPERAAAREGQEELGVPVKPERLIGVYSEMFKKPGHAHHLMCFGYEATLASSELRPPADEIEEARWFQLDNAIEATHNPFAKAIYNTLKDNTARPNP